MACHPASVNHVSRLAAAANGQLAGIAGVDPRLLELVDARAIARQLGEPARMRLAGRLAAERASLLAERGDAAGAGLWRRKAAELDAEAERAAGARGAGGGSTG